MEKNISINNTRSIGGWKAIKYIFIGLAIGFILAITGFYLLDRIYQRMGEVRETKAFVNNKSSQSLAINVNTSSDGENNYRGHVFDFFNSIIKRLNSHE